MFLLAVREGYFRRHFDMFLSTEMLETPIVTELCFLTRVQFAHAALENRKNHSAFLKTHTFSITKSSERSYGLQYVK
jgi:hypothetical protein